MPDIGMNLTAAQARSMGISVTMDPSAVLLVSTFNKLGLDIRSFKEPLKRSVQQVAAPSITQNFNARGRPSKWQALADTTVMRKQAIGFSSVASQPLVRTGTLKNTSGQLSVWDINGVEGTAVFKLPDSLFYGNIHQSGAALGSVGSMTRTKNRVTAKTSNTIHGVRGYIPQRVFAILQDSDIDDITGVFDKWLDERLAAAGF